MVQLILIHCFVSFENIRDCCCPSYATRCSFVWWRHTSETFSVLLALYDGTISDGYPSQMVKRAMFQLLWAQSSCDLRDCMTLMWRHCNEMCHTLADGVETEDTAGPKFINTLTHLTPNLFKARIARFVLELSHCPEILWAGLWHISNLITNWQQSMYHLISMASYKTAINPLLTHWSYCSFALSHRYYHHHIQSMSPSTSWKLRLGTMVHRP